MALMTVAVIATFCPVGQVNTVGAKDGLRLGNAVGDLVGSSVGDDEGLVVGSNVGKDGCIVGCTVG